MLSCCFQSRLSASQTQPRLQAVKLCWIASLMQQKNTIARQSQLFNQSLIKPYVQKSDIKVEHLGFLRANSTLSDFVAAVAITKNRSLLTRLSNSPMAISILATVSRVPSHVLTAIILKSEIFLKTKKETPLISIIAINFAVSVISARKVTGLVAHTASGQNTGQVSG